MKVSITPTTEDDLKYYGDTIAVVKFEFEGKTSRIVVPKGLFEYADDGVSVGLNLVYKGHYE